MSYDTIHIGIRPNTLMDGSQTHDVEVRQNDAPFGLVLNATDRKAAEKLADVLQNAIETQTLQSVTRWFA